MLLVCSYGDHIYIVPADSSTSSYTPYHYHHRPELIQRAEEVVSLLRNISSGRAGAVKAYTTFVENTAASVKECHVVR